MTVSKTLIWLTIVIALLAVFAALMGLFWNNTGQPYTFTTLRGEQVEIYGRGLYRYDTSLIATGYRIGDTFILLVGVPLLLISLALYRRGSLVGGLFLGGTLAFLLYSYSSLAIGAAYNNLFLVYILLTAATMIGLAMLLRSVDQKALVARFTGRAPVRGISIFLIVTGILLFLIWLLLSILPALLSGTTPPELASYTTIITFLVDMGIIAPILVAVGVLLRRRDPLGCLLAPVLLVFLDVLGLSLMLMGTGQMLAGLMSMGQFIGFVVSFAILTIVSIGFTVALFRDFKG